MPSFRMQVVHRRDEVLRELTFDPDAVLGHIWRTHVAVEFANGLRDAGFHQLREGWNHRIEIRRIDDELLLVNAIAA
jgi:hypothetical protein